MRLYKKTLSRHGPTPTKKNGIVGTQVYGRIAVSPYMNTPLHQYKKHPVNGIHYPKFIHLDLAVRKTKYLIQKSILYLRLRFKLVVKKSTNPTQLIHGFSQ